MAIVLVDGKQVELPAGMTPEQYLKLTSTFLTAHVQGKKRDKAIGEANKALRKKYSDEYGKLLNTELKKVGLPVR